MDAWKVALNGWMDEGWMYEWKDERVGAWRRGWVKDGCMAG